MNSEELGSEPELLAAIATLLNKLRFTRDMPREAKWGTTEQLTNEMELLGPDAVAHLDRVLREDEAQCLDRLAKGLSPRALIRRAKYPDRTTALPLWGSVKHHGPPWVGYRPDQSDPLHDVPSTLFVPDSAPHALFLVVHRTCSCLIRTKMSISRSSSPKHWPKWGLVPGGSKLTLISEKTLPTAFGRRSPRRMAWMGSLTPRSAALSCTRCRRSPTSGSCRAPSPRLLGCSSPSEAGHLAGLVGPAAATRWTFRSCPQSPRRPARPPRCARSKTRSRFIPISRSRSCSVSTAIPARHRHTAKIAREFESVPWLGHQGQWTAVPTPTHLDVSGSHAVYPLIRTFMNHYKEGVPVVA
jgi:hypothetical protein